MGTDIIIYLVDVSCNTPYAPKHLQRRQVGKRRTVRDIETTWY